MKTRRIHAIQCAAVPLIFLLLPSFILSQEQQRGREKYLCSEPNPQSVCTAENTCGTASTACTVQIKRSSYSVSVDPSIPNAKKNEPFCVKAGTKMIWESPSKNTGFVIDFGPDSPFGQEAIMGGSGRTASTLAKKKGCYKYSAGACVSGSIDGMCGSIETELIITGSE
jgi:hypothetical protein